MSQPHGQLSKTGEGSRSPEAYNGEVLPKSPPPNRLVIFGSRMGGAFDLADAGDKYLREQGIEDAMVHLTSNSRYVDDVFYGRNSDLPNVEEGLPLAVIAFPEMRYHDELGGMTVDTPIEYIKQLCEQHGIPIAIFTYSVTPEEIMQGMGELVPGSNPETQSLPPA